MEQDTRANAGVASQKDRTYFKLEILNQFLGFKLLCDLAFFDESSLSYRTRVSVSTCQD